MSSTLSIEDLNSLDDVVEPEQISITELAHATGLSTRTGVGVAVWRVVSHFLDDHEPLAPSDNQTLAEAAEAYVEAYADMAEGERRPWPRLGVTEISPALHSVALLDDYLRMKHGEQSTAFEEAEETLGQDVAPEPDISWVPSGEHACLGTEAGAGRQFLLHSAPGGWIASARDAEGDEWEPVRFDVTDFQRLVATKAARA